MLRWLDLFNPTIASLYIAGIAAIAAIIAAYYAKKALTKEDLKRLEANTAETAATVEHLRSHIAQTDEYDKARELVEAKVRRLDIQAIGSGLRKFPLTMTIDVGDPGVALTHVELLNEADNLFGSFDCTVKDGSQYVATIDDYAIERWFIAATPIKKGGSLRRAKLRVHIEVEAHMATREFAVEILVSETASGDHLIKLLGSG
jgi:hypothetical protein